VRTPAVERGGVFAFSAKNHPGKQVWVGQHAIKVNAHSTRYLPIARYEADRAWKLLTQPVGWDVPVKAVLVILMETDIPQVTIKQMPEDVVVLDRVDIHGVFKRSGKQLTPAQVDELSRTRAGQASGADVLTSGSACLRTASVTAPDNRATDPATESSSRRKATACDSTTCRS